MKRLKIIIAIVTLLSANTAFAITAVWTGNQVQVQTVTYKYVWKCEYMFAGQKFWKLSEGSCPNSIEVE